MDTLKSYVNASQQTALAMVAPVFAALGLDMNAEGNPVKEIAIGFILIAVSLVIALTILPVVTSAVATQAASSNISASDATLLRLLPTLLIVGLLSGGVAFLFRGFKQLKA